MFGQESWPLKNILSPHLRPTVCLSEVCEWKNGGEERMSDSEASTALIKENPSGLLHCTTSWQWACYFSDRVKKERCHGALQTNKQTQSLWPVGTSSSTNRQCNYVPMRLCRWNVLAVVEPLLSQGLEAAPLAASRKLNIGTMRGVAWVHLMLPWRQHNAHVDAHARGLCWDDTAGKLNWWSRPSGFYWLVDAR